MATDLRPPTWLPETLIEAWHGHAATAPADMPAGVVASAITALVVAEDQYQRAVAAQAALDQDQAMPMLMKGSGGRVGLSPYMRILRDAEQRMMRAAQILGTRGPQSRPDDLADDTVIEEGGGLVNKAQLATLLGMSLSTLYAWLERYKDDFPIVRREGVGGARRYLFDPVAAAEFVAETRAAGFNHETADASASPSMREQLDQERLRSIRLKREKAEGQLVDVAVITTMLQEVFATNARHLQAFLDQIARENGWPAPIKSAWEGRMRDMQRAFVESAKAALRQEFTEDADVAAA